MSVTITTAQVQQFRRNIEIKYQQMGSMLRGSVRIEPTQAKFHFFDLLAPTSMVKNTGRHADTPLVNSQHERRRAEMQDYDWADLVDKQDKVRILVDPEGSYVQNAAMALGRSNDEAIIEAFDAVAFEGETGATQVPFDAATFDIGGAVKMSVSLLRDAKRILDEADVPDEDRHIAIAPKQLQNLLEETEVTSSDFNTVRALVMGDLNTFLGFQFHRLTPGLLPLGVQGANQRSAYAWHKTAMGLATGIDIFVDVGPRRDKRMATQVYVAAVFGAVRIQDAVVRINSDESL